jgi:hypothetical protein
MLTLKTNLEVIKQSMEALSDFPPSRQSPTPVCGASTLFLYGTRSTYIQPDSDMALAKRYFPNAHFTGLDAGHWVHSGADLFIC